MSNIINFPGKVSPSEDGPIRLVACRHCHQSFFHLIVVPNDDDDEEDIVIECALCGHELAGDDTPNEGWN